MNKFSWKQILNINIFILKLAGMWPENGYYKLDTYAVWTIAATVLFTIGHNFFQLCNIILTVEDLESFTTAIFITLESMMVIPKAYYLVKNMDTLRHLVKILTKNLFKEDHPRRKILIEENLNSWKNVYQLLSFSGGSTTSMLMIFAAVDRLKGHFRLPLIAWYPYNTKNSPLYEVTFLYQFFSGFYFFLVIMNIDTLIAVLNVYVGVQCDILCDKLRQLDDSGENVCMEEKLEECVQHHREILSFAEQSKRFYDWIVFIQFFVSAISSGLTMFQLTVTPLFSDQFCTIMFYESAVLMEVFIYCWFGNEVEIKSKNIPLAAYESNWIDASSKFKKDLLFFILRCQKPIKLASLNLFYLSLDTFVKILRASWSYFALLRQINGTN